MGVGADREGVLIELRRVVYRCELLQNLALPDGDRQALWDSVVIALADIKDLGGCDRAKHELFELERSRHISQPEAATVVPDGVSVEDLESGCLAPPCVDPDAARALAEALIAELTDPSKG